jgi:iron complex outermembrane receptor protein
MTQEEEGDTVITLQGVSVVGERAKSRAVGLNILRLDSVVLEANRSASLSEVLARHTTVQVKTYGSGGLATASFRGIPASHTGLFWHGVQLNPPGSYVFDMALVPTSLFSDIELIRGGSGPLMGGGSTAGSIHLGNSPVFNSPALLTAGVSGGSFHDRSFQLNGHASSRSLAGQTGIFYKNALNDFPFTSLAGQRVSRDHAKTSFLDVVEDLSYRLNAGDVLSGGWWYHLSGREIPPTLTTAESHAEQHDRSVRAALSWSHLLHRGSLAARTGFLYDRILYEDPDMKDMTGSASEIISRIALAGIEYNRSLGRATSLAGGADASILWGESNNYEELIGQHKLSFWLSSVRILKAPRMKISAGLRKEFSSLYNIPFIASVGFECGVSRNLLYKMNLSRNFREPGFNDLYWKPGGNRDLKPEDAWNAECGLAFEAPEKRGNRLRPAVSLTLYNYWMRNMIVWMPLSGSLWSPRNFSRIWARGAEVQGSLSAQSGDLAATLSAGFAWTLTGEVNRMSLEDLFDGNQLIYIPRYKIHSSLTMGWKKFAFSADQDYHSTVFTTTDNRSSLPWCILVRANLSKTFTLPAFSARLQASVDNLLDRDYQLIPYYPMPGRSFTFSLVIKTRIKQKQKIPS